MKYTWAVSLLVIPMRMILSQQEESLQRDQWYKKYSVYPSICSTPEQIQQRHIPPLLPPTNKAYSSQLLHASVIIRHGSRAPTSIHPCWKGYSETAIWNCDLVTLSSTPIWNPSAGSSTDDDEPMLVYEKRFDAFTPFKTNNSRNILNGTCEVAQLLQRGYDQEYTNGDILRKAYIWDDNNNLIDSRLLLFNLSTENNDHWFVPDENGFVHHPWDEPFTFYRSDDDPRTIMSGQVLLRGLFHSFLHKQLNNSNWTSTRYPRVAVHTADRVNDILAPNENQCPRLAILSKRAKDSHDYKNNYIHSKEAELMQQFAKTELGIPENSIETFRDHALDCLITTICTDRELPQALNYEEELNHTSYGPHLFQRLIDYVRCFFLFSFFRTSFFKIFILIMTLSKGHFTQALCLSV